MSAYISTPAKRRREHVPLAGRRFVEINLAILIYLHSCRRWISTAELMERFNIGRKQVERALRNIEAVYPIQIDSDNNGHAGGRMNWYKAVKG